MDKEYDVILVGTSLVQSILGAALAREGKKVLCIDDANWYGGLHATLNLTEFVHFMSSCTNPPTDSSFPYYSLGTVLGSPPSGFRSNEFCIDLQAKVLRSRGVAVDILAESGVSRYIEFQPSQGCFFYDPNDDHLVLVPHSKSQIFSSTELTMVEKRQLMRFLQFASDFASSSVDLDWINDTVGTANLGRSLVRPQNLHQTNKDLLSKVHSSSSQQQQSFSDFLLQEIRLSSPKLRLVIEHGLANGERNCALAMQQVSKYLLAMNRFGSTPYLHPMYGTSELCQAFSRLCSVYGGTQALRTRATSLSPHSLVIDSQEITAKLGTVIHSAYVSSETRNNQVRALCVANRSLLGSEICRAVVSFPNGMRGIQVDSSVGCCPSSLVLFYLFQPLSSSLVDVNVVVEEMKHVCESLALTHDAEIVWMAAYACVHSHGMESSDLTIVDDAEDVDACFVQAQDLFAKLCPQAVSFLPRSQAEVQARREEEEGEHILF